MIQHGPIRYDENGDDDERAAWLLALIDESPDRLAVVPIPDCADEQLDALEERFIRAYDIAKLQRPGLAVKLLPALEIGGRPVSAGTAALVVIHEHKWVAGQCVNGCRDTRPL